MKRAALAFLLVLAVVPSVASAQIGFGLSAGLAMPRDNLSNGFNSGYHVQGSVNISPPLSPVGFRIDGTYDNFAAKPALAASGSFAVTGLSANIVYGLGGLLVGPYVLGGAGYYQNKLTLGSGSSTASNPGFDFGAGLKFGVGSLGASVEARYVMVNGSNGADPSKFIPITFGISF